MVKKKSGRPKSTRKRKSKKSRQQRIKKITGLALLLAFVFFVGFLTHYVVVRNRSLPPAKASRNAVQARYKIPAFEIYPKKEIPPPKPIPKPIPKIRPRIAIIIDDLGYERKKAEKFLQLNGMVTLSILPHSPYQKKILRKARAKGFETMLHLPMEPIEYPRVDPGPGALFTTMSPNELIVQLEKNLAALPTIKGVNNHMGSRMTTLSTQMYQIFSILKKRNLYFIDSRTNAESLCRPSARLLKVPFAQRDVFLDHDQDPDFIRKQIKKLIRIAVRHGESIGIGHPYTITYQILRDELPKLKSTVEFVPASAVVHIVG